MVYEVVVVEELDDVYSGLVSLLQDLGAKLVHFEGISTTRGWNPVKISYGLRFERARERFKVTLAEDMKSLADYLDLRGRVDGVFYFQIFPEGYYNLEENERAYLMTDSEHQFLRRLSSEYRTRTLSLYRKSNEEPEKSSRRMLEWLYECFIDDPIGRILGFTNPNPDKDPDSDSDKDKGDSE